MSVAPERDLRINWCFFSLALKNNDLENNNDNFEVTAHKASHRILRIMLEAQKEGADIGEMYTYFGGKKHLEKQLFDDEMIKQALNHLDLPDVLFTAADNTHLDQELNDSTQSATDIVGNNVGVPIITFEIDNQKTGFFGPVLNKLPDIRTSLNIWDSVSTLAQIPEFSELKRRHNGPADTTSTKT